MGHGLEKGDIERKRRVDLCEELDLLDHPLNQSFAARPSYGAQQIVRLRPGEPEVAQEIARNSARPLCGLEWHQVRLAKQRGQLPGTQRQLLQSCGEPLVDLVVDGVDGDLHNNPPVAHAHKPVIRQQLDADHAIDKGDGLLLDEFDAFGSTLLAEGFGDLFLDDIRHFEGDDVNHSE